MALSRKPYKGERIEMGGKLHTVVRTPEGDDNICHMLEDGHDKSTCFIWRFCDTLNVLATLVLP